ncbi:ABC transporter ATP-binding protein [Fuchsiella alkaliacetigena]|uniref:ABC transporter ATP-binding protein n=1 Tax=Fuchsiella alkaliacetigena TaxID=957042 RepID=UPI00200B74E3|nr:ABC transporter ATP-binding protein [Fuchsiella alkaliacetigena]MCK8824322.1 ABC transporter ATP-binding protein/permease [Fuchsiella alkaliacetigena]
MLKSLSKLWQLFNKRERLQIFGLFGAILFMALSQVIGVASIMPFMDLVMQPEMVEENQVLSWLYTTFEFTSVNRFIVFAGIAMFVLIMVTNGISTVATWLKYKFVWMNNHRLAMRLLRKYLGKPYAYFLINNSSDLGKNVLQEVKELTKSFIIKLIELFTYGAVALAIIVFLLITDVTITLAAIFILGGSYGAVYYFIRRRMEKAGEERLEANKQRYKTANEAFNGIKQIKISGREEHFLSRFAEPSLKDANLRAWRKVVGMLPRYILEAIAFGGIVLLVVYLILAGQEAREMVPLVSLFAFAGYRLMPALQKIFYAATDILFNMAVLDKIHEDMFETGENEAVDWSQELPEKLPFKDKIELEDIQYTYPNDQEPVLKGIDLSIQRNTAVAFAGETGAGKSTLVNLLLGLLTPDKGEIKIDGVELNQENIRNWQRNIGYVPQDIYLCDDTILSNIAFGVAEDEIDLEAVKRAAKIANIDGFIENELAQGYQTVVGERGVRVSGGQKQRLGLARALYHDPEVLVLDEATSSLDGATQEAVMEAIENIAEVKTMIMIAHRLSTVRDCDTIYMLGQGRIVDSGSYDELVGSNVMFRKLADLSG